MDMPVPDPLANPDRRYVRHSREYLASQRWTAERVRRELVDERHPAPRYEFLDGELIVSPSPELRHQLLVVELTHRLRPYVEAQRLGRVVNSPSDVAVAPDSTTQPDVFVIPADEVARVLARRGHEPVRRLQLAVEVLSPSSGRVDRLKKRRFYGRNGVADYWVVDPDARVFETSVAGDERVTLHDATLRWQPEGAAEGWALDVAGLFADMLGPPGDAESR